MEGVECPREKHAKLAVVDDIQAKKWLGLWAWHGSESMIAVLHMRMQELRAACRLTHPLCCLRVTGLQLRICTKEWSRQEL